MASTGIGLSSGQADPELDDEELEIDHVFMEEYRNQRLKGIRYIYHYLY